jgi:hypothetical protein
VIGIPLASCADQILARLAALTGSDALTHLDGATLLGERAMLGGFRIPGRISAGGGCRLFDALGDTVVLNLARDTDRELLPALFETDALDPTDEAAIASLIARADAAQLVARGRSMGLAIAAMHERLVGTGPSGYSPVAGDGSGACDRTPGRSGQTGPDLAWATAWPPHLQLVTGLPRSSTRTRAAPRVLDLSALWAGPLAAHLLWLAGAEVVKVESRTRPDAMRMGDNAFYSLLNQGKASVALDLRDCIDKQTLLALISSSDIVIEAARPRALAQLGIDAAELVRTTPGLVWMTLTAHGATGDAANWVGFGDDCAIAGGLSAALHEATGATAFVGDAIADPLTGILSALVAWQAWMSGRGGRFALAMSQVAAQCLAQAHEQDPVGLRNILTAWAAAAGKPFPTVRRRPIGTVPAFGEHTDELRPSCAARAPS